MWEGVEYSVLVMNDTSGHIYRKRMLEAFDCSHVDDIDPINGSFQYF
jgi:hypothetical protein